MGYGISNNFGMSPLLRQLLGNLNLQTQGQAGGFDPLGQLQSMLQGAGNTGGAGLDPRMLRHVLRRLDRQIVETLLSGMNGGAAGATAGATGLQNGGLNGLLPQFPQFPGMQMPQCLPMNQLMQSFPQCTNAQPQIPCLPPPPAAQPPPPKPLEKIAGKEKGGWLCKHGEYKKNKDGSYDITKGQYAGYKAVPSGNGSYNVVNPQGQTQGTFDAPKGANKIASPLSFDLNGNGKVGTTGVENGKQFDLNGDGKIDKTAWAEKGDGVLAFDRDGDGVAGKDGKELLGNNTDLGDGKKHANGFEALKALATKHLGAQAVADGKLDKNELAQLEQKAGLTMMVDGQKKSLTKELGFDEVKLGYQEAGPNADENGNEHRQVGAGFVRNGEQGKVNDVWFKYQ